MTSPDEERSEGNPVGRGQGGTTPPDPNREAVPGHGSRLEEPSAEAGGAGVADGDATREAAREAAKAGAAGHAAEAVGADADPTRLADSQVRERVLRFQSLSHGAVFAGRYEIREPIGSGGSGEVYRAFDRIARADVALKVLYPGSGERDIERLRREMRLVRSLQHPGIVRVHDIGECEGLHYTVSELLVGESLATRLHGGKRLEPAEAETILRGVLEALAVAHDAGVIHRDIKPANIFLCRTAGEEGADKTIVTGGKGGVGSLVVAGNPSGESEAGGPGYTGIAGGDRGAGRLKGSGGDSHGGGPGDMGSVGSAWNSGSPDNSGDAKGVRFGRVVLLDFGLAREAAEAGLTATGRFLGTPEYSSPEQIRGEKALGPATDLYACGVTLWRMLSGTPPFTGASDMEILSAHLSAPLPPPRRALAGCPARLRSLATQLLEKRADRRPASARAALRWLEMGEGTAARAAIAWSALRSALRRRAVRMAAGAAVLCVAGAFLLAWLAVPVKVELSQERDAIIWHTRGGWTSLSALPGRTILSVALAALPGRLFATARVALERTRLENSTPRRVGVDESLLYDVSYPGNTWKAVVFPKSWNLFRPILYRFFNPPFFPIALERIDDGSGAPTFGVALHHNSLYPARIVILYGDNRAPRYYDHPGWISDMWAFPDEQPTMLIAAAYNNLLGPRQAVFALRLSDAHEQYGQGPPYAETTARSDTCLYYLPLPYSRNPNVKMTIKGQSGIVTLEDGSTIQFDLNRGIPEAPDRRGGMTEVDWGRRRDAVMKGLAQASGDLESGEPASGAARLESLAGEDERALDLYSIVMYRAAQLRMASARSSGRGALEMALDDCTLAMRESPVPARYGLLKAEILARLGRREQARSSLVAWWRDGNGTMYNPDWSFITWLAGGDVGAAVLAEHQSSTTPGGYGVIRVAAGLRAGDFEDVWAVLKEAAADPADYDSQELFYLGARSFLDQAVPEPAAALAQLDIAATRDLGGTPVPVDLARLRASLMLDAGREPTRDEINRAAQDLEQVLEQSYVDVKALYLLGFALRDGEAILKIRPDLEVLATAVNKARTEYDQMVNFDSVTKASR